MPTTLVHPNPLELRRLKRWRTSTFWVMLIGYIGYYLVRGNLPVAMPLLSREFNYSNTQLGSILTFSELCYALGKFTMGPLADHAGGKKIFVIGLCGAIVFNFLFPLHPSIIYFTVIWCGARFFLSMGWGGLAKTIGQWYEPERNGFIMGVISINFQLGGSIAALFAGFLIAVGVGWQGLFYWPATVASVIVIWAMLAAKESPQAVIPNVRFGRASSDRQSELAIATSGEKKSNPFVFMKALLKIPIFRELLVFSFLIHILRSFFMYWIPKFMVDIGMGDQGAAMTSAVFPLAGCLGTIALGWYTDRYSRVGSRTGAMWKMLLAATLAIFAIAPLIVYRLEYAPVIILLLAMSGFCVYGPYSMSSGCLTLDIAGSEGAGTCSGLIDGVGYIGGTVAALGTGILADILGWKEVFWSLSAFSLLTTAWLYFMSRSRK